MCPVQAGGAHRSSAVITGPMIYFSSNRSEGPVTGLVVYLSSNRPEDPLTGLMVDFSPSLELVSRPTIYFSISFRGIIYFPWHRQIEETDRVESLLPTTQANWAERNYSSFETAAGRFESPRPLSD